MVVNGDGEKSKLNPTRLLVSYFPMLGERRRRLGEACRGAVF
jgi:hypothetical protein